MRLKDLLYKLLKRNSADRINFEDFSTHEFLSINPPSTPTIDELTTNFNTELKILDDQVNNAANKIGIKKNTFKNIQEQKRINSNNKPLQESYQEPDIYGLN